VWREVSPDPVAAPTPKEIVQEMRRREHNDELPEDFKDFNLNNKPKLEMK
jgi:hypothetical protein